MDRAPRAPRADRTLPAWLAFAAIALAAPGARAEGPAAPDGIAVGEWTFRPTLELRSRAEYARFPVETGGAVTSGPTPPLVVGPVLAPPVEHQWLVHERARVGISAERSALAATVIVQDARLWGSVSPAAIDRSDTLPSTSLHVAFAEAHTSGPHPSFVRIGRQEVSWGDGRLLGVSDWSPVPRALDAVRGKLAVGSFDVELLAAMLSPPGAAAPEYGHQGSSQTGTGAELYGIDAAWHVAPLLHLEATGLARVVRDPAPLPLTPSDTYVAAARVHGDRLGVSYALEGAYELGRVAIVGDTRDVRAFAGAARAQWQTAWPWHLTLGAFGSYASGDDGRETGALKRFDPILPDVRTGLGQMGLFAWSNLVDGGVRIAAAPGDDVSLAVAYHHVSLADPHGAWYAASLTPISQLATNEARTLGEELDASIAYTPWNAVKLGAGYGAFVTGAGAKNLLATAGRGDAKLLHAAYLQVTLAAP